VVKAVDEAGQSQPENPDQVWNFAGYLSTAWHRVTVEAVVDSG
jgi:sulfite oxidase